VKKEWDMYSKRDIPTFKQMTLAERKVEAMRQLKASFDRAAYEGTLRTREVTPARVVASLKAR
jgi:hypothetical protein